jgi:hypothetical protein
MNRHEAYVVRLGNSALCRMQSAAASAAPSGSRIPSQLMLTTITHFGKSAAVNRVVHPDIGARGR